VRLASQYGRSGDPVVRQALACLWSAQAVLGYLRDRIRAAVRTGRPPGPEGSVAKLAASRLALQAAATAVAITGPDACAWDPGDPRGDRWSRRLAAAPGASIGGGTDAVLRNIIGERVLGLPKEPQVDRDIPWREIAELSRSLGAR
jgi:alkylation response protein AidB-like acyl-CoA dehydrogenase